MSNSRPQAREVEDAIRDALRRGRPGIEDVAQILNVSRSTVERALAEPLDGRDGTNFTRLRNAVRVPIVLELLTSGVAIRKASEEVCVTPDHMTVLVREATGLTPGQITRATRLRSKVAAWKREGPVRQGTVLYRKRLREWDRIDRQTVDLLGDLDSGHPLATWAKRLVVELERPDFRRKPYRDELEEKRRARNRALQRRIRAFLEPEAAAAESEAARERAGVGS